MEREIRLAFTFVLAAEGEKNLKTVADGVHGGKFLLYAPRSSKGRMRRSIISTRGRSLVEKGHQGRRGSLDIESLLFRVIKIEFSSCIELRGMDGSIFSSLIELSCKIIGD